jgi:hypothetical protein
MVNTPAPTIHTYSNPDGEEFGSECDICTRSTRRRCSICNKGYFCSNACEQKRSGLHLFNCSKRPLTTADYLWQSIADDLLSVEEDVLEDFGFQSLLGIDRNFLLGVYKGLYLHEVSAEDIHEWRTTGVLLDKIKQFYLNLPEGSRGLYFPWLLQRTHILERPMATKAAKQTHLDALFTPAQQYLDPEDRNTPRQDLQPKAKLVAYILLAQVLQHMGPDPREPNWYSFGFVTCRMRADETLLVTLYQQLLTPSDGTRLYNRAKGAAPLASFAEFWKAHQGGTLVRLMDAKGLKEPRTQLPYLGRFLSNKSRPSVWELKYFLDIADPMEFEPSAAVSVDYGFGNCSTFETCVLVEIYSKILASASPLELDGACRAGIWHSLRVSMCGWRRGGVR